jgi:RPA family protein
MAGSSAGFSREVAKRVFIEELKRSNHSFREGEEQNQYAPSYLLTPTGAKCNRVFVVGTLIEKDNVGSETQYWKGRVVDPTGSISIYAGQYQPEAAQILADMDVPEFVAVVGKPNLFQTDDGNIIISLRIESIQRVDKVTQNQWLLDTARRTLERLQALKNARAVPVSSEFATADNLPASSSTSIVAQDADRALQHYNTDLEHFRQMVLRVLSSLKADLAKSDMPPEIKTTKIAIAESEKEPVIAATEPEEMQASRKSKPKKSESLSAWPESENEEEVETFNLTKKS